MVRSLSAITTHHCYSQKSYNDRKGNRRFMRLDESERKEKKD
jgi:hypothetical protein